MNKLLVMLPSSPADGALNLSTWLVPLDGEVQSSPLSLPEVAQVKFSELVVVVPVSQITWHRLILPTGVRLQGDSRLLPVLQNLLEEVILGDPHSVHIALSASPKSGTENLVAVCNKTWLGGWLQTFEKAGLRVGRVVPQIAPDMLTEEIIFTGRMHEAWLTGVHDGMPLSLPASIESAQVFQSNGFLSSPSVYDDACLCVPERTVELLSDAQWVTRLLDSAWDLAQHEFASNTVERWRRKSRSAWQAFLYAPAWRPSRIALISLAGLMVIGLNAKAWWSQKSLNEKKAAMEREVQQQFPHVKVVLDAPLQMQREVQNLYQSSGLLADGDLQPLLAAAGAAFEGVVERPVSWEYSGGTLLLRGMRSPDVQVMNHRLRGTKYSLVASGEVLRLEVAR